MTVAVVAIVAITLAAYYYGGTTQQPQPTHRPTLDSWGVQSDTRFPMLWINASDAGDDLVTAKVNMLNATTLAIQLNETFGISSHGAGESSRRIIHQLNCTMMRTGSYYVRLVLVDLAGLSSDLAEKTIVLPDNTPPLPEIVGTPWVRLDTTNSTCHFLVNATDGDGDGLEIVVIVYERDSWERVYSDSFANTGNNISWFAEGTVSLQPGKYMLKTSATDKAGWQSLSELVYFEY